LNEKDRTAGIFYLLQKVCEGVSGFVESPVLVLFPDHKQRDCSNLREIHDYPFRVSGRDICEVSDEILPGGPDDSECLWRDVLERVIPGSHRLPGWTESIRGCGKQGESEI